MSSNKTAICIPPCGTNKQCTVPNTCTCVSGWTGINCSTGIATYPFEHIIQSYNNTAICIPPCGTNKQCTAPNTCTCVSGWTGSNCLTGMVIYLIELLYVLV